MRIALVLTFVLAGCIPQPAPDDPPPPSPKPTPTTGADDVAPAGLQGQPCGSNDACVEGTACVKYYGVAGAKGPEFASCEIRCASDAQCPAGQGCTTVSDGPGQVCRARAVAVVPGEQGKPCGDGDACVQGTACVKYYGVAGPKGPQFTSCEIRCASDAQCPKGQGCTTISDGPGQVCRTKTVAAGVGTQGKPCGANDACEAGTTCVSYYGIAGPKGPRFTSCEIKCTSNKQCPQGQGCTTISDGPGQVCR